MKVITPSGETFDLGATEEAPTVGIIDFSRRETDDYGVTTVVERSFSRRMSVRLLVPFDEVDSLQQRLAALRATAARWVADERFACLSFDGFYKEFDVDLNVRPVSWCTMTVEGLAASDPFTDPGNDPAPDGRSSTLQVLKPTLVTDGMLTSNVPEADYPQWSAITTYPLGARVLRGDAHRIFESVLPGNLGHDPAADAPEWIDIGPTNRWAMFDRALGSVTSAAGAIVVTLAAGTVDAVAVLDVKAATVRVQAGAFDRTESAAAGAVTITDIPSTSGPVTVTIAGLGQVEVGTLLIGRMLGLGITEANAGAGITDYSRKEVDEFGEVTIVERAWAKRMTANGLVATEAVDLVFDRIAAVRALPCLWIGQDGLQSLSVYGFFKEFSIELGENVSKLSLSIEGLSTAGKVAPLTASVDWPNVGDPNATKPADNATRNVNRGDWAPGVTYNVGDFFQYGGSSYTVITAHISTAGSPPPNQFVSLLASGGSDGLPGVRGADGVTFYTWIAYADSADGTLNFTTGAPNGRTFIGIASNKATAVESVNPAEYTWSAYAGPPNFGLVAGANAAVSGARVYKVSGPTDWNSQVVSSEAFAGGVTLVVRPENLGFDFFVGLNTDPFTDSSYLSLDYAWRMDQGRIEVWANGTGLQGWDNNFNLGDTLSIQYNGKKVRWIRSGNGFSIVFWEADAPANLRFWLDSSLSVADASQPQFTVVTWAAGGAAGADGANGAKGDPGTPGEAAITPSLTASAQQVWAYANGVVKSYDGVSTTFVLKQGGVDVSANFNVVIASNPNGLQVSLSGRTATVVGANGNAGEFGNVAVLSATLTLRATGTGAFTGRNFDLSFALSKLTGGYEIVSSTPTIGNFEGREVFNTGDGKRYTYVNGGWVATITSATVIADSQLAGMSATKLVGTVPSAKLGIGIGGNRLLGAVPSTRPDLFMFLNSQQNTGSVYQMNATYGGPMLSPLPNGEYPGGASDWTLPDFSGFGVHQTNTAKGANPDYFMFRYIRDMSGGWTNDYACEDGKSYELSLYVGTHRCTADILLIAARPDGSWAGQGTIGAAGSLSDAEGKRGGTNLNAWKRLVSRVYVPPGGGATRLLAYVRKFGTDAGQSDSWMFMCYPQLVECTPNASEITPYSPPAQAIMVAENIYARSITGQQIAVDTLGATEIAARQITAKHVTMTDYENLMVDGDLASGTLDGWSRNQNGVNGLVVRAQDGGAGTSWPSRFALYMARNGNTVNELSITNSRGNWDENSQIYGISVSPGDEFAFECQCWASAGSQVIMDMIMRNTGGNIEWLAPTGVYNTAITGGIQLYAYPGEGFTILRGNFKYTGGNLGKAYLRLLGPSPSFPNAQCYWWNMKLRRRNNAQLIVDGQILTNHLASGLITTDKLGAGQVTAAKMAVTELSAITANLGLMRTATVGRRTEIDSNGMRAYDANGTLRVRAGVWAV